LRQQAYHVVNGEKAKTTEKGGETILHGIMESELPASDKTVDRLYQEALTVVGAGGETTGGTLDTITYHVLVNPEILKQLKAELARAFPPPTGSISDEAARRLRYLSAVINEGLRMAGSVSGRLARSNPTAPIVYDSYVLAPGTVVSMTLRDLHTNPFIYPQPATFNPERWIDANDRKRLELYHVPFSRGSRSCIGKDLAMVELYLAVANLFSRFDMKLFETSERDISMEHDFFAPFGPSESKGLQVIFT
jgi:cytochrome P450